MHYSLKNLALLMLVVLLLTSAGASVVSFELLRQQYHTEEEHHRESAQNRLLAAAKAIGNQVSFYQGIVDLVGNSSSSSEQLVFAEPEETERWSRRLRNLLPGAFGLAMATPDGEVIGNPTVQRVGPSCTNDLFLFARGDEGPYPPVHREIPGLEHFDLVSRVTNREGEQEGLLFLSFRLDSFQQMMQRALQDNDHFLLLDGQGLLMAETGIIHKGSDTLSLDVAVNGTDWTLRLVTQPEQHQDITRQVIGLNLLLILIAAAVIGGIIHRFARRMNRDLDSIHRAMTNVLKGDFSPGQYPSKVAEIARIVPDIEQIAAALHEKTKQLREQSLTDPLTGLRNRRHFDVIIHHQFERSKRHVPALLMLIDVNDFKLINDRLGHKHGDMALRELADFLRSNTRASDECARLGGDEFAVILEDIALPEIEAWVEALLRKHDQRVDKYVREGLNQETCTLSVGICAIDSAFFPTIGSLLHAADVAMYRAKAGPTGSSRFHLSTYDHPGNHFHKRTASTTKR